MKNLRILISMLAILFSTTLIAQYNSNAGENRVTKKEVRHVQVLDDEGKVMKDDLGKDLIEEVEIEVEVTADKYGNAEGTQYDLATDGAFEGNTVAVLHLYTGEGFDFSKPKAALEQKGFSVYRWIDHPPSAEELREQLKKACQLWVISSNMRELNDDHAEVIKDFFESGKGLYIWGDNEPYYADANFLAEKIFGTTMIGNVMGDKTVGISGEGNKRTGIVDGHLISTGVANMYEGITIATVNATQDLSPLVYGSEDNLVTAVYEKDGKRAIIDGGFTRLFLKWETAGTDRYVKNAAAWLVNYERFGELVYDEDKQEKPKKKEKNGKKDMGMIENEEFLDPKMNIKILNQN